MSHFDDLRGIQATQELQFLNITGNVIPHNWFKTIKMDNGAPDLHAIVILSEIVYWYKPVEKFNEKGIKVGITKKYEKDLLQKSYADLAEKFGTTKRQVRDAMTRLEKRGIVERDFRTIMVRGIPHNNVLFIALNVDKLKEYTIDKEIIFEEEYAMTDSGNTLLPEIVTGGTNSGRTNTKITSKITTNKNKPSQTRVCEKVYDKDSDEYKLTHLFIDMMIKRTDGVFEAPTKLDKWYNEMRLLIDSTLKNVSEERLERCKKAQEIILYVVNDDFWHTNILSIPKLRKQAKTMQLKLKAESEKAHKGYKSYNNYNTNATPTTTVYKPVNDDLYGDVEI